VLILGFFVGPESVALFVEEVSKSTVCGTDIVEKKRDIDYFF